jgi:FMN phosphatase YigB (HAD superfamily)
MKIRAVIFDVYKTLLDVGPPPAAAEKAWAIRCAEDLGEACLSLADFGAKCAEIVERTNAASRLTGIPYPEIFWPAVALEALPGLASLSSAELDDFLYAHAQMVRTLRLMPDAAATLRLLEHAGLPLGIASNAQPYTLRELDAALSAAELDRDLFTPALCCWSFDLGFSKPNAHVFRVLNARLHAAGVSSGEILMVGDRLDNDIAPAQAQGWQTWNLAKQSSSPRSGDWAQLLKWLQSVGVLPSHR